jgi:hypothetical protein
MELVDKQDDGLPVTKQMKTVKVTKQRDAFGSGPGGWRWA